MDGTHIDVRGETPEAHNADDCRAMADILARIGDKWTVMVVGALSRGPLRYNQVHKLVEGVSQRMLTLTLKGLERDGLVTRTVLPTNPPRVDYELTDQGRTLITPLQALLSWAQTHRGSIEAAREAFDRRALDEAEAA